MRLGARARVDRPRPSGSRLHVRPPACGMFHVEPGVAGAPATDTRLGGSILLTLAPTPAPELVPLTKSSRDDALSRPVRLRGSSPPGPAVCRRHPHPTRRRPYPDRPLPAHLLGISPIDPATWARRVLRHAPLPAGVRLRAAPPNRCSLADAAPASFPIHLLVLVTLACARQVCVGRADQPASGLRNGGVRRRWHTRVGAQARLFHVERGTTPAPRVEPPPAPRRTGSPNEPTARPSGNGTRQSSAIPRRARHLRCAPPWAVPGPSQGSTCSEIARSSSAEPPGSRPCPRSDDTSGGTEGVTDQRAPVRLCPRPSAVARCARCARAPGGVCRARAPAPRTTGSARSSGGSAPWHHRREHRRGLASNCLGSTNPVRHRPGTPRRDHGGTAGPPAPTDTDRSRVPVSRGTDPCTAGVDGRERPGRREAAAPGAHRHGRRPQGPRTPPTRRPPRGRRPNHANGHHPSGCRRLIATPAVGPWSDRSTTQSSPTRLTRHPAIVLARLDAPRRQSPLTRRTGPDAPKIPRGSIAEQSRTPQSRPMRIAGFSPSTAGALPSRRVPTPTADPSASAAHGTATTPAAGIVVASLAPTTAGRTTPWTGARSDVTEPTIHRPHTPGPHALRRGPSASDHQPRTCSGATRSTDRRWLVRGPSQTPTTPSSATRPPLAPSTHPHRFRHTAGRERLRQDALRATTPGAREAGPFRDRPLVAS